MTPLSFVFGKWMNQQAHHFNSYNLPFLDNEIKRFNPFKLDRYIRNSLDLFNLPIEKYMKNGLGVKFETIFANHLINCTKLAISVMKPNSSTLEFKEESCFCSKYQDKMKDKNQLQFIEEKSFKTLKFNGSSTNFQIGHDDQKIEVKLMKPEEVQEEIQKKIGEMFGQKYRKIFFVQYIGTIFQKLFQPSNKHKNDASLLMKPTFIFFLLQIAKTPLKAYQQILFLKEEMKIYSLQSQALFQEIIDQIISAFNQFIESSPFQNQRLDISAVFLFDQFYKDFKASLKEAILCKQHFYEFLCSDFINLSELLKQSQVTISSKRNVEQKILNLFDINPDQGKIQAIAELYIDLFDFRKRRVRNFVQRSKELLKKKLQRTDLKINLFGSSSCVLFLSLHSNKITRASDTSVQFFLYSMSSTDLVGKPFVNLLPSFLESSFNKYIESFLNEGNLDLLKIGEYFTFIKNPTNPKIVIPIYIRSKVDVLANGEFGISMLLNSSDSHQLSIITDEKLSFVSCTSSASKLLLRFLSKNQKLKSAKIQIKDHMDSLKSANIKNFIPLLYCIGESDIIDINSFQGYNEVLGFKDQRIQKYQTFRSLLILPSKREDLRLLNQRIGENPLELSDYFNQFSSTGFIFYEISFTLFFLKISKAETCYRQLDIVSHRRLYSTHEINELFYQLKESLQLTFSTTFNFQISFTQINQNQIKSDLDTIEKEKQIFLTLQKETIVQKQLKVKQMSFFQNSYFFQEQVEDQFQDSKIHYDQVNQSKLGDSLQHLIHIDAHQHKYLGIEDSFAYSLGQQDTMIHKKQEGDLSQGIINYYASERKALSRPIDLMNPNIGEDQINSSSRVQLYSPKIINDTSNGLVQTSLYENELLKNSLPHSPLNYSSINIMSSPKEKDKLNQDQTDEDTLIQRSKKQTDHKQNINDSNILQLVKNNKLQNKYQNSKEEQDKESGSKQSKEDIDQGQYQREIASDKTRHKGIQDEEESQEEEMRRKRIANAMVDDQQSVRTGQSQVFSQRQSLFDMIISRREPPQITFSKYLGIFSFVVIIVITSVLFIKVKDNFDEQWINYTNLTIGPNLLETIGQVLRVKELLTFVYIGSFAHYLVSPFDATLQQGYINEALQEILNLSSILGNIEAYHIQQGFEDYLINNKTTVLYSNIEDFSQISVLEFGILYTLMQYPINLLMYLTQSDIFGRTFVYSNYQAFISVNIKLLAISSDQAKSKLKETQQLLQFSIIIIEMICICAVLTVFPIYYLIQTKRQQILNLLATFDPIYLRQLIQKFKQASQLKILQPQTLYPKDFDIPKSKTNTSFKQFLQNPNQSNLNDDGKNQNKSKRRQISQTNQLPKFSFGVSLVALITFIIISMYSLLNYLLNNDFFKYFEYHIEELSFVAQTQSYLSLNYCGMYLLANSYAYKFREQDVQLGVDFYTKKDGQFEDNQNRLKVLESIDQNFIEGRYQIGLYTQYFLNIVKKDACPILSSPYSAEAIKNNPLANISLCNTTNGGVLSRGLAVAMKYYYQKIESLLNAFTSTYNNQYKYFSTIYFWDLQNNLQEFDLFSYYLRAILQSESKFLINQSSDYFDYLRNIQYILFSYSIISVSVVFLIAWRKFLSKMYRSIASTTYLLSLMPIDNLLENPYIMSYLNKEKSRQKRR